MASRLPTGFRQRRAAFLWCTTNGHHQQRPLGGSADGAAAHHRRSGRCAAGAGVGKWVVGFLKCAVRKKKRRFWLVRVISFWGVNYSLLFLSFLVGFTQPNTNMTIEKQQFEDVSPILTIIMVIFALSC